MRLKLKHVEFSLASLMEVCPGCLPTKTPTQKLLDEFYIFSSHEIGLNLVSLNMIFEALQSELF